MTKSLNILSIYLGLSASAVSPVLVWANLNNRVCFWARIKSDLSPIKVRGGSEGVKS